MKVAVIGAGIAGVTSAWELAVDGHEVTVFERRGSVAAEASFANAGIVAPSFVRPWSVRGLPGGWLRSLLGPNPRLRLHAGLRPSEMAWLWRSWRGPGADADADADAYADAAVPGPLQRLAAYSRDRLKTLTRTLKLDYERAEGVLVLLRSADDEAMAGLALDATGASTTRFERLDATQCRAVEPGLSDETPLHGGIYLPDDEVGNCRQFATLLRTEAQRIGVRFRFHTDVEQIVSGGAPQLVHVYSPPDDSTVLLNPAPETATVDAQDTVPMPMLAVTEGFDAVVVCTGMASPRLLRSAGLRLPLHPVYGYSVTAPLRRVDAHGEVGPRAGLWDARHHVAISRLGSRVRAAGITEIGGHGPRHDPKSVQTLYKVLHDWFPGSCCLSQAQVWKGARPLLPDGRPVLGPSGVPGVYLNLGHGGDGWVLACGSARLTADAVSRRLSEIPVAGLGLQRFGG